MSMRHRLFGRCVYLRVEETSSAAGVNIICAITEVIILSTISAVSHSGRRATETRNLRRNR